MVLRGVWVILIFSAFLTTLGIIPGCTAVSWPFNNLLTVGTKMGLAIADSISLGAEKALEECKKQFKWERWNCPEWSFESFFKNREYPANREMAFVRAIINAGIVHTLTRNCSNGDLVYCYCDKSRRGPAGEENSTWGGCSDSTELAEKIAEDILDSMENGNDPRAMVNLHNNALGRHAVQETMTMNCRCLGLSERCSLKTCWMQVAQFEVIGQYLKRSYRSALKIDYNQQNQLSQIKLSKESLSRSSGEAKLLYIEDSPNYCLPNESEGIRGTAGRQCSRKRGKDVPPEERQSCRNLCQHCGLKVKKQKHKVQMQCNCKFHWCCEVRCDKCTQVETIHTCQQASV